MSSLAPPQVPGPDTQARPDAESPTLIWPSQGGAAPQDPDELIGRPALRLVHGEGKDRAADSPVESPADDLPASGTSMVPSKLDAESTVASPAEVTRYSEADATPVTGLVELSSRPGAGQPSRVDRRRSPRDDTPFSGARVRRPAVAPVLKRRRRRSVASAVRHLATLVLFGALLAGVYLAIDVWLSGRPADEPVDERMRVVQVEPATTIVVSAP